MSGPECAAHQAYGHDYGSPMSGVYGNLGARWRGIMEVSGAR